MASADGVANLGRWPWRAEEAGSKTGYQAVSTTQILIEVLMCYTVGAGASKYIFIDLPSEKVYSIEDEHP